jgi:curved DNA-binding protein
MAVQFRDYYETLGVSKTATSDEIKNAFRKLARKHHPDVATDKKTAEEKFKEINEAYEVLSDPEKRRKYDEFGANWRQGGFQPPPGWQYGTGGQGPTEGFDFGDGGGTEFHFGGTGFSDFFEQLFGSRRRGGGRAGGGVDFGNVPMRGQDVEADIMVTLEEAFHGSTRQISFRRGDSPEVQTYTVKIPKGVREGQRIRLAGQGGSGFGGAQSGDLFLRVKFQKHPDFEVEGTDLYREVPVPAARCVLGGEVEVQTLDGRAKLRIPPGTQNGKKFRLPGKGLPAKGGARGDFYAVVDVVLPAKVSDAERKLWEKLALIS